MLKEDSIRIYIKSYMKKYYDKIMIYIFKQKIYTCTSRKIYCDFYLKIYRLEKRLHGTVFMVFSNSPHTSKQTI